MESVIRREVGAIFVPVNDMQRSVLFYGALFGVELGAPSHGGRIVDMPLAHGQMLILDGHKAVVSSSQALCYFLCDDVEAARKHLVEIGAPLMRDIEDIGGLFTLTFSDPDGNLLMVCQKK